MERSTYEKEIEHRIKHTGSVFVILCYTIGVIIAIVSVWHKNPTDEYYRAWAREFSFYSFSSSMQYFAAGIAALICYIVTSVYRNSLGNSARRSWLWLAASAGFVYATYDEYFMIHEKLLTHLDHASPWLKHFYFNAADDMFLISCGIAALVFTVLMFREISLSPRSMRYYILGTTLLIFAGLLDYLPGKSFQLRLPLGLEELFELFAGTSYFISFTLYFLECVKRIVVSEPSIKNSDVREPGSATKLDASPIA